MKHIIAQIIEVANELDINHHYAEANVLTKIAQQLHLPGMEPRIRSTYQTWDEDSDGDPREQGWEDEEGEMIHPDEFDDEEGLHIEDLAVRFLEDKGADQPSNSNYNRGTFYTSPGEMDPRSGDTTDYNYHLHGFSPKDEERIYKRLTRR